MIKASSVIPRQIHQYQVLVLLMVKMIVMRLMSKNMVERSEMLLNPSIVHPQRNAIHVYRTPKNKKENSNTAKQG